MDDVETTLRTVADRCGTPAYVYFWDRIEARAAELRAAFEGRFGLSYAVKANPNRALVEKLSPLVAGLDVSSRGELDLAVECGYAPARISFSGPAKTRSDLERAVDVAGSEVIVESIDEMRRLAAVARARGVEVPVLLRVNPANLPRGFGLGMSRLASHFGIDEEELDIALEELPRHPELRFRGFHVYAGTQCLSADAIGQAFTEFVRLWAAAAARHRLRPERLVFGSGFGIRYDALQKDLDLGAVAERVNPLLRNLRDDPWLGGAETTLELGRYLVGQAGIYLTRVIRTKVSRGKRFAICDGGLNHHLAATGHFGSVVRRNYPIFKVVRDGDGEPVAHDLVGPLCTSIDLLGMDVMLPELDADDLVAIESSGAYGLTASPVYFIHHPRPREVLVEGTRGAAVVTDVTGRGTPAAAEAAAAQPGEKER
jgi:diaminopimelate decarboxylase